MKNLLMVLATSLAAVSIIGCSANKVIVGNASGNDVTGNDVNVIKNPINSPTTSSTEAVSTKNTIELYCAGVSTSSEERVLMGKIGSHDKGLMRIKSGVKDFGYKYPQPVRCEEIKFKTEQAISMGATGFKADVKNRMIILCGAKGNDSNSECIRDEHGRIMEIATFPKGVSINKIAEMFSASMKNGGTVSSGARIVDNPPNYYIDFAETITSK